MFLTNQTNKKSLNDYSQLVTKIRNEYNILVKENEALKSQLEQYKNYYDANIVRQKKNLTSVIENENPTIDIVIIMIKMMIMKITNWKISIIYWKEKTKGLEKEKSCIKILFKAMNHLHPLKLKKELMMKQDKKMMMRLTKLEKLKSNSQKVQKRKL